MNGRIAGRRRQKEINVGYDPQEARLAEDKQSQRNEVSDVPYLLRTFAHAS